MFKVIFKWIMRVVLVLLVAFIIVPYFIPRDGNETIPSQPFANSLFVRTASGVRIHTRIYEPTQPMKGQIMLVHGLGGSTYSYEENAPFLASLGYFVVTVDLPAFGFSTKQRKLIHSQTNRAEWLWDVLDQIEVGYTLNPSWILGGHSMGGSVALAMNNAQPTKTKGLILIDPAITNETKRNPVLSFAVKSTPAGEWLRIYLTYGLLKDDSFKSSLSSAYGVEASDEQVEAYLRPLRVKGSTQALREFFATAQGLSVSQWLYPDTPVILVWGEKDEWIPISDKEEVLEFATNVIDIVLENEGHNPMETNPSLFNEKLALALSQWAND